MEQSMVHLAETAAWLFVILFIFAIIGVIATIRWIFGLIFKGEQAVVSGVQNIEKHL
jgi:hypothetical protein